MTIKYKEIFLRTFLLGSICNFLIAPSQGMEQNDEDDSFQEKLALHSNAINQNAKKMGGIVENLKKQAQDRQEAWARFDEVMKKYDKEQEPITKIPPLQSKPAELCSLVYENYGLTDTNSSRIAEVLTHLKSPTKIWLTKISFRGNKFSSASLQYLLPALELFPNLEILDLSKNLIDNNGGKKLISFVDKKPSLNTVELDGNPINEEIEKSINRILGLRVDPQHLDGFTFCCCDLTDEDAPQVAHILSQKNHLKECNLSGNKFTSQSLKHILPALNSHLKLQMLAFEENLIDDEGGKELLAFVEKKASLRFIVIAGNPLNKDIKRSINKVVALRSDGLSFYSKIKDYTFRNCGFTDEDAPQIGNLLSQAKPLTRVNLRENELTSEGLKIILPYLEGHSNLEVLDLENNLIDDEGVKELLVFLEATPSLKKIYLGRNKLTKDAKQFHKIFTQHSDEGQYCHLF